MDIAKRLRSAIEERYKTVQAFSRAADVPYRTIYQYLSGTRLPGSEALLKICAHLGINIHWLLTGEGEKYTGRSPSEAPEDAALEVDTGLRDQSTSSYAVEGEETGDDTATWKSRATAAELRVVELEADLKRFQAAVETYRQQEVTQLLSELGLTDLAVLARRGTQESIWAIMTVLEEQPTKTMSLDSLAEALQKRGSPIPMRELVADLAILGHKGVVRETSEAGASQIQFIAPVSRMAGKEVSDISQIAKDCIRELARRIVPLAEEHKGRGYIARISCKVPHGAGAKLVKELPGLLIGQCSAAEVKGCTDETVDIVFGIAHSGS